MNYKNLLYEIQHASPPGPNSDTIILPSNQQLYSVDLNTRTINGPETLSVQSDHYAETVYFLIDRYYDNMDLTQTTCIIQYAVGDESYIYTVPFCDTTTYEGKMIIPWTISASATKNAGTVKYFIRFYLIDKSTIPNNDEQYETFQTEFAYSLSTLTSTSVILKTLSSNDFIAEDDALGINAATPERYFELIQNLSEVVDNAIIYWIDANDIKIETPQEEDPLI